MKENKSWKIEHHHGKSKKFERNFIKKYKGSKLSMHKFPKREKYRHIWIENKYLDGLLQKYIGKSIDEVKKVYNLRTKNIENTYTLEKSCCYLVYQFENRPYCRGIQFYKYIIEDNIVKLNPEYKPTRINPSIKLYSRHIKYNMNHIVSPDFVQQLIDCNSPVYLGRLYVQIDRGTPRIHQVWHYKYPDKHWKKVNIGLKDGWFSKLYTVIKVV